MNGKLLLSILLIGVLLAGCINLGGPAVPTEETKPADQVKPEVTRPSLNILSPLDDAVVKTEGDFTDIEVSIETSNLVVKSPGGKNKVGEGNIVYTLDDGTSLVSVNKKVTLSQVGVGEHTVSVEIKQNDQTSYFPKIVKTVNFKVEKFSTEIIPKTYEVAINNFAFNPAEITVHVGDSITWKNTDTMPHTATSTGNFDTGTIPSGQSKTITMNKEGTFSYQCILHPNMKGVVVVYTGSIPPTTTATKGITVAVIKFRDNDGNPQQVYNGYNGQLIGDSLEMTKDSTFKFTIGKYTKTLGVTWIKKNYEPGVDAAYLYIGSIDKKEAAGPFYIGTEFNLGWTNIRLEEIAER